MFDYLIVGAGFAGSVLAERLATVAGKRVLLCDKRNHIGGNAYDHYNDAGIIVHKYGPHIFHTNSRDVFEHLSKFTEWRQYEHHVLASADGQLIPIPINLETINQLYNMNLNARQMEEFLNSIAEPCEKVRTSEDVVVSKVGRELYEKLSGTTRGNSGISIPPNLTQRLPRVCQYASIATLGISATPIRRCRCMALRACSKTCSTIRTSPSA